MDEIEILKNIGLTVGEAKVYNALLSTGQSSIGPIAQKSTISYSKVPMILNKLIDKGLINHITKNNTKLYSVADTHRIIDYLEQKKESVDNQLTQAQALLPILESRNKNKLIEERIELYEGLEGLKTIYNENIDRTKKGGTVFIFGAGIPTEIKSANSYNRLLNQISRKRLKKKIKYKIVFNEKYRNNAQTTNWEKMPLTKVRYLLNDTPGSINIQEDRIMMIYWHKEKVKVFYVESEPVANSFKQYFDVIWKQAKL